MNFGRVFSCLLVTSLCSIGCSDDGASAAENLDGSGGLGSADELPGKALTLEVGRNDPVYVDLSLPKVVKPDSPSDSKQWDIMLQGWEIRTNSGPSGPGSGASFGPTDELDFLFGEAPDVPFLREDTTGGAFLDWYAYDSSTHSLYSRFHVYGVRSHGELYKLQLLGYYGEQLGAPVSALYRLRYARVDESGSEEPVTIDALDATAGGPNFSNDQPSGCLVLDTGAIAKLTPAEARASEAWDLCFRRDTVTVNGELGGPGKVTAVDLQASETARENLDTLKQLTAMSELPRFESVDHARLTDDALAYHGDRVISGFGDRWFEGRAEDAAPTPTAWLVRGADGEQLYLVVFTAIDGTAESVGRVSIRVRPVESRHE